MATNNPLRKPINRAEQLPRAEGKFIEGIKLYDVDSAIFNYMNDIVVPKLKLDNAEISVPVIYGNAERWKAAQIDGVYRDKRGKIQLPLVMFKRTTIERSDGMEMPNRLLHYPAYTKYSTKNRYDKFSILNNFRPRFEKYEVTMPDYVDINYEVMIWTNFTEHMNTIVESFKWAADEHWGDREKFKFKVYIDSFDKIQEVTDNQERIIRTTFNLLVKAYLLPDRFDNEATTKKTITNRGIIVTTTELDINNRLGENIAVNDYNSNKLLYDYLEINNTKIADSFYHPTQTSTFDNAIIVQPPSELDVDVLDTIKVFINGVKYSKNYYTLDYLSVPNTIKVTFNTGLLGFSVEYEDEVYLAGKFLLV